MTDFQEGFKYIVIITGVVIFLVDYIKTKQQNIEYEKTIAEYEAKIEKGCDIADNKT